MLVYLAGAIFFGALLSFIYAAWRAAPWVPTWSGDIARSLRLAQIGPGLRVYDLGCGDGRLVCAAAAAGADGVGYEISWLPYVWARLRALSFRGKVRIHYRDFWHVNLGQADVVYCFLLPKIFPRLKTKLEAELRPGAKVITYVWAIPGWQPVRVETAVGQPKLYLYQR